MVATFNELQSPVFYFNRQESLQCGSATAVSFALITLSFDGEESGRVACAFQHTGADGFFPAAKSC